MGHMRRRRILLVLVAALLGASAAPAAGAATYYVSASGSDSAAGTSPTSAWRTVGKVNGAALQPGDVVLFEGGATFSDAALMPSRSGTSGARIVYGSYGSGRAALPRGIWLRSVSSIEVRDFRIASLPQAVLALSLIHI